jgi:hypothetical protein
MSISPGQETILRQLVEDYIDAEIDSELSFDPDSFDPSVLKVDPLELGTSDVPSPQQIADVFDKFNEADDELTEEADTIANDVKEKSLDQLVGDVTPPEEESDDDESLGQDMQLLFSEEDFDKAAEEAFNGSAGAMQKLNDETGGGAVLLELDAVTD